MKKKIMSSRFNGKKSDLNRYCNFCSIFPFLGGIFFIPLALLWGLALAILKKREALLPLTGKGTKTARFDSLK